MTLMFCWMFQIQRRDSVGSVASFYSHRTIPLAAVGLLPTTMGPRRCPVLGQWDRHCPALTDPFKELPLSYQPPGPPALTVAWGSPPWCFTVSEARAVAGCPGSTLFSSPAHLQPGKDVLQDGKMVNRTWFKLCITYCSDSLLKEDNPPQEESIQRDIIQKIIIVTSPRGWFSLIQCLFFITVITLAPHNLLASCWLYK